MTKNLTHYRMTTSYKQRISTVLQKYAEEHKLNATEMMNQFNEKMNTKIGYSTFRAWFVGNAIPDLANCILLAKFLKLDIYELLYTPEEN